MERLIQERLESHRSWEAAREADRRSFLKGAAVGSLMVASSGALARQVHAQPGPASWTGVAALHSAAACAWENILFQAGHAALLAVGQTCGLPLANAALTAGKIERDELRNTVDLMERYPGIERKAYIHAGWFVPIREELRSECCQVVSCAPPARGGMSVCPYQPRLLQCTISCRSATRRGPACPSPTRLS